MKNELGGGYAQAGYIAFYNKNLQYFAEDNESGGNNTYRRSFGPYPGLGENHNAWVQYVSGEHDWRENIDSARFGCNDEATIDTCAGGNGNMPQRLRFSGEFDFTAYGISEFECYGR